MKFLQFTKNDRNRSKILLRMEDIFRIEENGCCSMITVDDHSGGTEEIECYESYSEVVQEMSSSK